MQYAAPCGDDHERCEVRARDGHSFGKSCLESGLNQGGPRAIRITHLAPEPPRQQDGDGNGGQLQQCFGSKQRLELAAYLEQQFLHVIALLFFCQALRSGMSSLSRRAI